MEIDDRLLEKALAGYASEEPRPGVEQRILARVAARRSGAVWMLPACAVVAASLVVIVTAQRHERVPIPLPPAPVPVAVVAPAPEPPVTVRHEQPKPSRFPSPAPLTREERAWLTLSDTGVVAGLQPGEIEPIQIEELTIPPIESEGGN